MFWRVLVITYQQKSLIMLYIRIPSINWKRPKERQDDIILEREKSIEECKIYYQFFFFWQRFIHHRIQSGKRNLHLSIIFKFPYLAIIVLCSLWSSVADNFLLFPLYLAALSLFFLDVCLLLCVWFLFLMGLFDLFLPLF